MNEAISDKQSRPYWENKIVECSDAIPFDKSGWFTCSGLYPFAERSIRGFLEKIGLSATRIVIYGHFGRTMTSQKWL